ncbi:hypothetical protein AM493_10215 [Flavobacterium akiainvivens]|uniref:Beta-xylanase n=1 Tax=Flavobacterium akiainvivens TaxID=1202724 RepID=A0A0M8MHJ2_9FLAO|nr:endo-1,4-beta-xylanase [Flavobacterium akiainvivens]KOS06361.1 hypothetical protein AM493_10215 [Flavobacterium akiainvivens]SFQ15206.1 endo-1,4-beta-xylanase [Flavobacterium akiainvivens]
MLSRLKILVLSTCLILLAMCSGNKEEPHKFKSVKLQSVSPFKIGVAIEKDPFERNKQYRKIVETEFNSITPANMMKMNRLAPQKDVYFFKDADSIVEFAINSGKRIHGHTLIWHRAVPEWVTSFKGSRHDWDILLNKYITTVVEHFKGKVHSWDVVNEAFEDNGDFRKNIWYEHLGKDYIKKAFIYAHKADPNAILFYNDYGQERFPEKNKAINKFILSLVNENVPIHGIGAQFHTNVNLKKDKIEEALIDIASTGLYVHISELTIIVNGNWSDKQYVQDESSVEAQMQKFADVINTYKNIVAPKQRYGITFWNVGDSDSYVPRDCNCKEYPQIFDKNYKKKNYFSKIVKALKN